MAYENAVTSQRLEDLKRAAKRKQQYIWSKSQFDIEEIGKDEKNYCAKECVLSNNGRSSRHSKASKSRPYHQSLESVSLLLPKAETRKTDLNKKAENSECNKIKSGIWDIDASLESPKKEEFVGESPFYINPPVPMQVENYVLDAKKSYDNISLATVQNLPHNQGINELGCSEIIKTEASKLNKKLLKNTYCTVSTQTEHFNLDSKVLVEDADCYETADRNRKCIYFQSAKFDQNSHMSKSKTLFAAKNFDLDKQNSSSIQGKNCERSHNFQGYNTETLNLESKYNFEQTDQVTNFKYKRQFKYKGQKMEKNDNFSKYKNPKVENTVSKEKNRKSRKVSKDFESKNLLIPKAKVENNIFEANNQELVEKERNNKQTDSEIGMSIIRNRKNSNQNKVCTSYKKSRSHHESYEIENPTSSSVEQPQDLVCIKVTKGELNYEFVTSGVDFLRIRNKFSKLLQVIPEIGAAQKTVNFSADVVKIILGFLFNPYHNFNSIQNAKTAVEVLSAAHAWGLNDLRQKFYMHIIGKFLNAKNVKELYSIASHLDQTDVCDAIKNSFDRKLTFDTTEVKYRAKNCAIFCKIHLPPLEFEIPLKNAEAHKLDDNFDRDIKSEITFEAISGCFAISGFELFFNVDEDNENFFSSNLQIYYNLTYMNEGNNMGGRKEKCLQERMIIYFNKKFIVRSGQKCQINIETEIKPYLCFILEEEDLQHNSAHGQFRLTLSSNYKDKNINKKRFFIKRLFYHEKKDPIAK